MDYRTAVGNMLLEGTVEPDFENGKGYTRSISIANIN